MILTHLGLIVLISCVRLCLSEFSRESTAFTENNEIPDRYVYSLGNQCSGENYSPHLSWSNAPPETISFAIYVLDPDGGNWLHWLQFNIPSTTSSLNEEISGPNDVGVKAMNSFHTYGYGGPCPPSGTHCYVFTILALDITLSLSSETIFSEFQDAVKDHILDEAKLTGLRTY